MSRAGFGTPGRTPNLRDLGGLITESAGVLRSGRLIRSGLPDDADVPPNSLAWPPAVVIDLRSEPEIAQHPSLTVDEKLHFPLLSQLAPGAHLDGTLIALYRAVLESAAPLLVDVVRTVAQTPGPVLVHCSAGKDRTGIAIALVLRLLGVGRDEVMADYVETNSNLDAIDARLRGLAGNEGRDALPREYFHVVPEALAQVLDMWDEHPGGVVGWFCDAGGTDDLITELKAALITYEPSDP